jgi:hypothetical protein
VETLGVLLVHGIGGKRRGDTLAQCTTALHAWLRNWLGRRWYVERPVELVDVSLAEAGPDHPPQARIRFRQPGASRRTSWLIAESCWFETYHRPGFYEFVRWALWVIPLAMIMHFVPRYRRNWRAFEAIDVAQKGKLTPYHFLRIQRALGSETANMKLEDVTRAMLSAYSWKVMGRLMAMQIELIAATAAGIVVQLFLAAVAVVAVIPGITRSFAGWVQKTLSATVGDSFMFVTSPITAAAVASRVRKDLEWLAERCDRVIVLAHSQGAAVSYRVIDQLFWEGRTSEKIAALVTYGSGLRKLFDLENNLDRPRLWILLAVWSVTCTASVLALFALAWGGAIPWWIAVAGLLAASVLQMAPVVVPAQTYLQDPEILPIAWYDLYASHDPVPNGPIDVDQTRELREPATLAQGFQTADVTTFNARQREVINRRSLFADHTSYWSNPEGFIARIASLLADASGLSIGRLLDKPWLEVSWERRLWRVTWLSRARAAAGLLSVSILFWPQRVLGSLARSVIGVTAGPAAAHLPEKPLSWWRELSFVPEWLLGALTLVLATWAMYLIIVASWTAWNARELKRFYAGEPYLPAGAAGWVFGLAWLGMLAVAPAIALTPVPPDWREIVSVAWAPVGLALWSGWLLYKFASGPGTPTKWGRIALACAQEFMADREAGGTQSLRDAKDCFAVARKHLERECAGSEEWMMAVLGEVRMADALASTVTDPGLNFRPHADMLRQEAFEALTRAGCDPADVERRLNRSTPKP